MEIEPNIKNSDRLDNLLLIGPLILDRQTKQATTSLGAKLYIDRNEFDALELLATREGEPLSYEQLYSAVWGEDDSPNSRDAPPLKLEHLIQQVDSAGRGFMWIEHKPEVGYIFHTRWAKDLRHT